MTDSAKSNYIWQFFRGKGLSEKATAAVMGNLYQESRFNPNAANSNYGTIGLAQWRFERNTGLKKYATQTNSSYTNLTTQLNYVWKELNGGYSNVLSNLKNNGNSLSEMTSYFNSKYEKSGVSANKRTAFANGFLQKFTGTKVDASLIDQNNTSGDTQTGWFSNMMSNAVTAVFVIVVGVIGVLFFMSAFQMKKPIANVKKATAKIVSKGGET